MIARGWYGMPIVGPPVVVKTIRDRDLEGAMHADATLRWVQAQLLAAHDRVQLICYYDQQARAFTFEVRSPMTIPLTDRF